MVPYHTIAFSQQKLRAALRRASGQDPAFTYGFVVHSRRHNEHPSLGLISLHGESLPLSERLLQGLDGMPLWLFGHARITLNPGAALGSAEASKAEPAGRPLASLVMHIATFDTSTGVTSRKDAPSCGGPPPSPEKALSDEATRDEGPGMLRNARRRSYVPRMI